jgi:hypothetical protein
MLRVLAAVACGLVAVAAGLVAWWVAALHPYQVARLPAHLSQRVLLTAAALVGAIALGGLAFIVSWRRGYGSAPTLR